MILKTFNGIFNAFLFLSNFALAMSYGASFVPIPRGDVQKLTWTGRAQYLKAFMAQHRQQSISTTANSINNNKCTPEAKFDRCCWQRHFWCPFYLFCNADEMRQTACQYPPGWLAWNCEMCLGFFINEYIECYADGWNNRDCCYKSGVSAKCEYRTETVDCGDYCDATKYYESDDIRYQCCTSYYEDQISACNKKASNTNWDTAAVRMGFCNRDCTPPWPFYCKHQ